MDTSWGCRVSHTVYRSLWHWPLVSFMKIYCLYVHFFCHIFTQKFMFLPNNQLLNSAIQRYFIGGTTLFSPWRKIELYQIYIYIFSFNATPIQGKNWIFTSQSCNSLPNDCTSVWASRYYFQHVFYTCVFNEQRSLFIIPQIGTFWSPEQNCLANSNAKLV